MTRPPFLTISLAVLSGTLWLCPLSGQGTNVSILGTVYDQSGAVLPGVTVTATEEDTGQRRSTVTDDRGRYAMAQMKIGRYLLEAELPGFQTVVRDVTLSLAGDAVANFTLSVGLSEEVVVTSEAALVDTSSSTIRNLISDQQIRNLPLNGRSFTDLASLESGVILDYLAGRTQIGLEGAKVSIAGTRSRQSLFQLDGTDMRNSKGSTPGSLAGGQLGVDTVQEFTVITNLANAEYGTFTGGVINAITKSGTNSFHGTLFEFHRNSALDARKFFDRDPDNPLERSGPPPFKRNQYGFTVGGPIKKDTLFFFGSFEGLNERRSETQTDVVPSLEARNGLIPNLGQLPLSPLTKPILDAYPLPNSTVRPDGTADYVYAAPQVIDEQYMLGKIDWNVNDRDSIAGRYLFDNATRDRPQNIDIVFDDSLTRTQMVLLEWKRVISPTLINEARISLNRFVLSQNFVDKKPLPEVMVWNPLAFTFDGVPWKGTLSTSNDLTTLGFGSIRAQQHAYNRFQYIDNLTVTRGSHSLKAGFNIRRNQLNNVAGGFTNGGYTFRSLEDLITAATPSRFSGTITGLTPRGMRQIVMGFYVQDDWRALSNFTLNLGLRYEPYTTPEEVAGRLGTLRDPSDTFITTGNPLYTENPSYGNFAPRIGFSWDPFRDGKTSIRAGYGIFYELVQPLHYWSSIHNNPPEVIPLAQSNPPFPNLVRDTLESGREFFVREGNRLTMTIPNVAPWAVTDLVEQGGVHQYQFSIDRELIPNLVVKVAYSGSKGYNLPHLLDRNTAIPQTDDQGFFPYFPPDSVRRNPAFSRIRDTGWDGSSWYNALGVTVNRRFSQNYSLKASYTFGKSIDNNSSTSVGESRSQPNGLSTLPDDVDLDRSLSDYDVRQRLTLNGSWSLPFAADNLILGGWTINGILTAAGGSRGTLGITFNHSRSRQTLDVPDRVSLIPGGDNNPILGDGRNPEKYFDDKQFVLGPPGYFGNVGRNTLELPGILTLDLSILKDFRLTEGASLQFRAEMFNLANRANFSSPSTDTIRTSSGSRSLTSGRITSVITSAREVQLALKVIF